jgi:3-deoxy-D-arabino-heptulosonate 7-phosphate (DAHP) synthase class II
MCVKVSTVGSSPSCTGLNQLAFSYKPLHANTIKPDTQAKNRGTNSIIETTQLEIFATLEKKPTNQI